MLDKEICNLHNHPLSLACTHAIVEKKTSFLSVGVRAGEHGEIWTRV